MTVAITRTEHTAALRRHAVCSADASVARRLLALALILDGRKRADAARAAGMDRQTLRDWVHRYNADGLAGLGDRHGAECRPGCRPSRRRRSRTGYGVDQMSRRTVSCAGAAWTSRRGSRVNGASLCTSAAWASCCIGSALLGCPRARAIPRRTRPCKRLSGRVHDPCGRNAARSRAGCKHPRHPDGLHETCVGQQGTLTYVWADKGSRPAALRDQRRQSAYLFGAVCADRGVGAALVLPHANAEAMSLHLAEISRHVAVGAHAVVVLDGAGWH